MCGPCRGTHRQRRSLPIPGSRRLQYRCTASFRAIATLAIFRPRRMARWKNLLRHSAHRDLLRFHQQKAQQHVALLADVSQPPPVSVSCGILPKDFAKGDDRAMKRRHVLLPTMLVMTLLAFGQDWQDCHPDGSYSFKQVKDSVRRMTTKHAITTQTQE